MTRLHLEIVTPSGTLVNQPVTSVTAEDLDGWFGIRPGRSDLVAALTPGLLVFRDAGGEAYVAVAGGLLELRDEYCLVTAREAVLTRNLDDVAERVKALSRGRSARARAQQGVMLDLIREAQRRLLAENRT